MRVFIPHSFSVIFVILLSFSSCHENNASASGIKLAWPPTDVSMAGTITELGRQKIHNLLLFRLVNSRDGSKHWIFCTAPIGIDLTKNFPQNSRLLSALREATTFIPESIDFADMPEHIMDEFREQKKTSTAVTRNFSLEQQLGKKHWSALRQIIRDHPYVPNDGAERAKEVAKLNKSHPMLAIDLLTTDITQLILLENGAKVDDQIRKLGKSEEKKNIALTSIEEEIAATTAYLTTMRGGATIDDLRELIDRGGTKFVMKTNLAEIDAYFAGDVEKLVQVYESARTSLRQREDKVLLEERNKVWIDSGVVQTHCIQGEVCFLYVGYPHLFIGENNFLTLLQREGFVIDRASPVAKK